MTKLPISRGRSNRLANVQQSASANRYMKTLADVISREGQRDVDIGFERNDRPPFKGQVVKMRPKSTLDGSSHCGPRSRYGDSNLDADKLRQLDTSKYLRTNIDEYLKKGEKSIDGIST